MIALGAMLLGALVVTAEPLSREAEAGDEIKVIVRATGPGLTRVEVTPPRMPDGVEVGAAQQLGIQRHVEAVPGGALRQTESFVWQFHVTATRPGTFTIPAFRVSNGVEVAASRPFEIRASGPFDARQHAFVEVRVDGRPRFVGEPIAVTLVIGLHEKVIDVVQEGETTLSADWFMDGFAGADPEGDSWPADGSRDSIKVTTTAGKMLPMHERGWEERAEGRFATWSARRRFIPSREGTLSVGPSVYRVVIGRNFQRDLFGGPRVARERKLALVSAAPVTIPVKALPAAGRTDAFSGLVGRLALDVEASLAGAAPAADAAPLKVRVGESLRVAVRVSGDGNVATTALPRAELDGFKRFGAVEEVDASGERPSRTLVYDVAPMSPEVGEIPAFALEVFDTQSGTYRRLASKPIPLTVVPGAAVSKLPDPPPADADSSSAPAPMARFPGGAAGVAAVFVLPALALGAFLLLGRLRSRADATVVSKAARRRTPGAAPSRPAFGDALAALPAAGPDRAKALLDAFAHHLAALAGVAPETFVGADLEAALAGHVPDRALRREAARLVAEIEAAAFGGAPLARDLPARAAALAAELERAFVAPR